jgi:uncharacterized membrane protein
LINTVAYRMNTVFKFYNQVWILLALGAACLFVWMIGMAAPLFGGARLRAWSSDWRAAWSSVGLAVSGLAILVGLLYPVMATGPRLAQRFIPGTTVGNLDALHWMGQGTVPTFDPSLDGKLSFQGDLAAIRWLQEHVEGSPVIAEASIGPYRCNGSRISNATGLPTIIGWERHEQQQRYPEDLPGRVDDVRTLYTSSDPDEKASILHRYNVAYVVVGDLERAYPIADNECTPTGSAAGIAAFERMVGSTLEVAHAESGTTIYRVLPLNASS